MAFCWVPYSGQEIMRRGEIQYLLCKVVDGVAYFPEDKCEFFCKSVHNSKFINGIETYPSKQTMPQDIYSINKRQHNEKTQNN